MKEIIKNKEEKNKVGRPRLADDTTVKKSIILVSVCIIVCFIFCFCFTCSLEGVTPSKYLSNLITSKLQGVIGNEDGFYVKESYDSNNDYIIEIKPSDTVKSYSGKYKYVLYELSGQKWKVFEEKEFALNNNSIKIKIKSLKNKNVTYKICLYILNGSLINKSFAPPKWSFSDSSVQNEKHAYKVFTVKGYYSPISIKEINETDNKKDVINVSTSKNNPRKFILNVPNYNYDALVKYTDDDGKEITLSNNHNLFGQSIYNIPSVNKSTKVTIKVFVNNIDKQQLEKIKLSNWNIKKDKTGNYYVFASYFLKPEKSY